MLAASAAPGSGLRQQHAVDALGKDALEIGRIQQRTGDCEHRIRGFTELRADHRFTAGIAQRGHERGGASLGPARHHAHLA